MLKRILLLSAFSFLSFWLTPVIAQDAVVDDAFKTSTIQQLNRLMNDFYVFPEVAKKTGEHLNKQLSSGAFKEYSDLKSFSQALTTAVQSINKDKHMRVRPMPKREAPVRTTARLVEDKLAMVVRQRENKAGFREVKRLPGNIGYLDLRGFARVQAGAPVADQYMALLSGSDAIIIDLRKNGGGDPGNGAIPVQLFFQRKNPPE